MSGSEEAATGSGFHTARDGRPPLFTHTSHTVENPSTVAGPMSKSSAPANSWMVSISWTCNGVFNYTFRIRAFQTPQTNLRPSFFLRVSYTASQTL
jgi:hypothetical protein